MGFNSGALTERLFVIEERGTVPIGEWRACPSVVGEPDGVSGWYARDLVRSGEDLTAPSEDHVLCIRWRVDRWRVCKEQCRMAAEVEGAWGATPRAIREARAAIIADLPATAAHTSLTEVVFDGPLVRIASTSDGVVTAITRSLSAMGWVLRARGAQDEFSDEAAADLAQLAPDHDLFGDEPTEPVQLDIEPREASRWVYDEFGRWLAAGGVGLEATEGSWRVRTVSYAIQGRRVVSVVADDVAAYVPAVVDGLAKVERIGFECAVGAHNVRGTLRLTRDGMRVQGLRIPGGLPGRQRLEIADALRAELEDWLACYIAVRTDPDKWGDLREEIRERLVLAGRPPEEAREDARRVEEAAGPAGVEEMLLAADRKMQRALRKTGVRGDVVDRLVAGQLVRIADLPDPRVSSAPGDTQPGAAE